MISKTPLLTERTASRLFDLLQQAELAYLMNGTPHVEYLRPHRAKAQGQLRKQLDRICRLDKQAGVFINYFLKEFGV